MHICFITNEYPKQNFPHGGIGTFIKVIANQLVKLNHKVSVIGINNYTNRNEEETDAGVNVYRLKPKKLKGVTWLLHNISINAKIKSLNFILVDLNTKETNSIKSKTLSTRCMLKA